jgi:hypothetical protein
MWRKRDHIGRTLGRWVEAPLLQVEVPPCLGKLTSKDDRQVHHPSESLADHNPRSNICRSAATSHGPHASWELCAGSREAAWLLALPCRPSLRRCCAALLLRLRGVFLRSGSSSSIPECRSGHPLCRAVISAVDGHVGAVVQGTAPTHAGC